MMILLTAASATARDAKSGAPPAAVTRPGEVLVDMEFRRREVAALPPGVSQRYCPPGERRLYDPVPVVDGDDRAPGERAVRQGLSLWSGLTDFIARDDRQAASWAVNVLKAWTQADALRAITGWPTGARYQLKRALLPMITADAILRKAGFIEPEDQRRIEAWLGRGVELIDRDNDTGQRHSNINNHRYSRDAVNMAWGILIGDDGRFREGVAGYLRALTQMRSDGSLPAETARGTKAIHYQNLALSILIPMAEMATHQGNDLYAADAGGVDIHHAVRFLVRAVTRPQVVAPYAPGVAQELHRMAKHLSWTEIYLRRFPHHANAPGLVRIRRQLGFVPGRTSEFSGGNLSCLFALPETNP